MVQSNDTITLELFSTVESKIVTDKNITEMAKTIKWIKKLKLSQELIK